MARDNVKLTSERQVTMYEQTVSVDIRTGNDNQKTVITVHYSNDDGLMLHIHGKDGNPLKIDLNDYLENS